MRDRSLDEFLDAGEEAESHPASDDSDRDPAPADDARSDAGGPPDASGAPVDDPAVEPAIRRVAPDPAPAESTYAFSPEGAPCEACGERVERRWRDDPGLVCDDCKSW